MSVQVRVCVDEFGAVWSVHNLSPEDERKMLAWPGGGTRHVGHALLTEAVRREAFNSALALLGREPDFLLEWSQADEDGKKVVEERIAAAARGVVEKTARKLGTSSVREILGMLERQMPAGGRGKNTDGHGNHKTAEGGARTDGGRTGPGNS